MLRALKHFKKIRQHFGTLLKKYSNTLKQKDSNALKPFPRRVQWEWVAGPGGRYPAGERMVRAAPPPSVRLRGRHHRRGVEPGAFLYRLLLPGEGGERGEGRDV